MGAYNTNGDSDYAITPLLQHRSQLLKTLLSHDDQRFPILVGVAVLSMKDLRPIQR